MLGQPSHMSAAAGVQKLMPLVHTTSGGYCSTNHWEALYHLHRVLATRDRRTSSCAPLQELMRNVKKKAGEKTDDTPTEEIEPRPGFVVKTADTNTGQKASLVRLPVATPHGIYHGQYARVGVVCQPASQPARMAKFQSTNQLSAPFSRYRGNGKDQTPFITHMHPKHPQNIYRNMSQED